jgi:N-formylglutamate amidohydrolase
MKVFEVISPATKPVPVLISVPHCGTGFPEEIKSLIRLELLPPDDTDFFVRQLYDFAPALGITMIYANYSRWVIDLNRDPESKPLYSDGRIITSLVPETDFLGNSIYNNETPTKAEIHRRIKSYYIPYHSEISNQIKALQKKFRHILLFDAHSIRKSVPSIQSQPFPDLILGDNQLKRARSEIIEVVWNEINNSNYTSSHNVPFQGGFITRSFGNPNRNIHALQLEMTKINYMDDSETEYHSGRAAEMRKVLKSIFRKLIVTLEQLNKKE